MNVQLIEKWVSGADLFGAIVDSREVRPSGRWRLVNNCGETELYIEIEEYVDASERIYRETGFLWWKKIELDEEASVFKEERRTRWIHEDDLTVRIGYDVNECSKLPYRFF